MDLRIFFLNMSNLKLEPADSPCQKARLFVKLCWDGFVCLRNCFFPLVCVRSFKPPLKQSSMCNEKAEFSYGQPKEWIYMPKTILIEALC